MSATFRLGVSGVPTLALGERLPWGADQLVG
jgi:hypothetical protein